ncbi:hypothetical protein ACFWWT_46095 [Streptomyces sp. NPDC058676]|uniref:hypothetical protein n=1 Tax=unclassified Streptomyces TaxID=2593676 RepID=UPI003663A4E7
MDIDADDIDLALSKAARHMDARADRLDELANALHLDNSPDNLLTSQDLADNVPSNPPFSDADDAVPSPEQAFNNVQTLVAEGGPHETESYLDHLAQTLALPVILQTVDLLRDARLTTHAAYLRRRATEHPPQLRDIPRLVDYLRDQGGLDDVLYQLLNQRAWSASYIAEMVTVLREKGQDADGDRVLSAVGRACDSNKVRKVMDNVERDDIELILDAACRYRPLAYLDGLQRGLGRHARWRVEAHRVEAAYTERKIGSSSSRPRQP